MCIEMRFKAGTDNNYSYSHCECGRCTWETLLGNGKTKRKAASPASACIIKLKWNKNEESEYFNFARVQLIYIERRKMKK